MTAQTSPAGSTLFVGLLFASWDIAFVAIVDDSHSQMSCCTHRLQNTTTAIAKFGFATTMNLKRIGKDAATVCIFGKRPTVRLSSNRWTPDTAV